MSDKYEIPEKFLRGNEPVHFYTTTDGAPVKIKLLPCGPSEEWAEKARFIDDFQQEMLFLEVARHRLLEQLSKPGLPDDAAEIRRQLDELPAKKVQLQKERFLKVKDMLREYAPDVFTDDAIAASTVVQLIAAFQRLRTYSDPLLADSAIAAEYQEEIAGKVRAVAEVHAGQRMN